jgi:hypothetical protein
MSFFHKLISYIAQCSRRVNNEVEKILERYKKSGPRAGGRARKAAMPVASKQRLDPSGRVTFYRMGAQ